MYVCLEYVILSHCIVCPLTSIYSVSPVCQAYIHDLRSLLSHTVLSEENAGIQLRKEAFF